jgi:hypothetical protein
MVTSVAPPGGQGTTNVIDELGKPAACPPVGAKSSPTTRTARMIKGLESCFIAFSLLGFDHGFCMLKRGIVRI